MKVFFLVCVAFIVAEAAVLPPSEDDNQIDVHSRQKRTLGIITAGAQAIAGGLSGAGQLAGAAVGTAAAAAPLIFLGLGKYAFLNWLLRRQKNAPLGPAVGPVAPPSYVYVYPTTEWVESVEPTWVEPAAETISYPIAQSTPSAWRRK